MTDAWDDEDFEPEIPNKGVAAIGGDKWTGEDEDDEIKANWDDEDEEGGEKKEGGTAIQVKKKKPLKERLAEKEAKKKAELEEQKKKAEELSKKMSPQEQIAEKLRRQKLQEEADLKLACDAFGVSESKDSAAKGDSLDKFSPVSKEDFETFEVLLKEKVMKYEGSAYYVGFLENFYRTLAVGLDPEDIKRLGSALNTLANEKTKVQKGGKAKKKKGPKLMAGKDTENLDDGNFGGEYDDYI